jgi:rfaE bifunctional protein nucleotidyltransferase chain/domain
MSLVSPKIVSREQLAAIAADLHARGATIVTCNGSFDLFHYGHLRFLQDAAAQGDVLIVGTNSDSSIKQYKSPQRPIVPQDQRAALLAALEIVDYVHIFDELVPMPWLEIVKPQIHANGAEYGADCIEAETVKRNGGRIHLVPKVPGLSTTELIARMKKL